MTRDPTIRQPGSPQAATFRADIRDQIRGQTENAAPAVDWLGRRVTAIRRWWRKFSLAQQFGLAAASVILLGMSAIGSWVTGKIEQGVTNNSAVAATLYMDAFVGPFIQELARNEEITPGNRAKLDEIMAHKDIRDHILSIKVWKKGGIVAYSNHDEIIGRQFAPTTNLKSAWTGVVSADLDGHSHDDDLIERGARHPAARNLRANSRGRIEPHHCRVRVLRSGRRSAQEALHMARLQSWGVVGGTALAMTLLLYGIVRRGSLTIEEQQRALSLRFTQNAELRDKIEQAYWRADRLNEQFLRRLGADLHDGHAADRLRVDKSR